MGKASREDYAARLDRVLRFLDTHAADGLDIDHLADLACFSRFHFQRAFVGVVGETPAAYLRRIRLESARRMIAERPSRRLTEIAFACGFSSSTLFSRKFRAAFRRSPRDVKKMAALAYAESAASGRRGGRGDERPPPFAAAPVRVERCGEIRLAAVRCAGYGPSAGLAYARLFLALRKAGSLGPGTRALGISFDDPEITEKAKCRFCAGAGISQDSPVPPGTSTMVLPAGKRAMLRYSGAPDRIDEAIDWLFSGWLPGSGHFPADAPLHQIVLKNPFRDGGDLYEAEICLPLVD